MDRPPPDLDIAALGARVRAALEAGRAKAVAQARKRGDVSQAVVLDLAALDVAQGKPSRGMAGRIARKLNGKLSESQVRKILRTLSSVRD